MASAASNPQVQQAVQQQAQQAVHSMQLAYCSSLFQYKNLLMQRPQFTFADLMLSQANWGLAFQKWNVLLSQLHVVLYIVFMLFLILYALGSLAPFTLLSHAIQASIYVVAMLLLGHMGWYCVFMRQGCCGGCGYAFWALIYACASVFSMIPGSSANGFLGIAYSCYLVILLPTAYMCLACWKMKVQRGFSLRRMATQISEAVTQNQNVPLQEETPAPPQPSAPPV